LSTLRIAEGLTASGLGKIITCEYDPQVYRTAVKRFRSSGLAGWIDARNCASIGRIDFLFCESETSIREQEVRRFLPQINPCRIVVMPDARSSMRTVRQAALQNGSGGFAFRLAAAGAAGVSTSAKNAQAAPKIKCVLRRGPPGRTPLCVSG
jgi:predicted O-methyltransferase YrrM